MEFEPNLWGIRTRTLKTCDQRLSREMDWSPPEILQIWYDSAAFG